MDLDPYEYTQLAHFAMLFYNMGYAHHSRDNSNELIYLPWEKSLALKDRQKSIFWLAALEMVYSPFRNLFHF
jgi:hypothetical protein